MKPQIPKNVELLWNEEDIVGYQAHTSKEIETTQDLDLRFEEFWAGIPTDDVNWLNQFSRSVERFFTKDDGYEIPPNDKQANSFRSLMIKANIRDLWEARISARESRDSAMKKALSGELGDNSDERDRFKKLAEALSRRDGKDLVELAMDLPEEAKPLGYDAACQLRAVGELDAAYALFQKHGDHYVFAQDDPLPLPPREGRGGVVVLERVPKTGGAVIDYIPKIVTPIVKHFNWERADHVIGCGTTITNHILDLIGVPKWKQHILEIHRHVPFAVGQSFPVLKGRVIVVDDVYHGSTSLNVARLYRGDVVNVSFFDCTHYFDAPKPLVTIENKKVEKFLKP